MSRSCFRVLGRLIPIILLSGALLRAQAPAIQEGSVVNAADYTSEIAPGMIISVFGANLAPGISQAESIPLPESRDGVRVEVMDGGRTLTAPLFFVSPTQINAQMPFDLTSRTVEVRVRNAAGQSSAETVTVRSTAPRFFTATMDGKGDAIAVRHPDWSPVSSDDPVQAGDVVHLFLTGLGAVSPPVAAGQAGGDSAGYGPLNTTVADIRVSLNGTPVQVVYFAGLAPGFVGLYQVSILVPAGLTAGSATLVVEAGGSRSQGDVLLACDMDWQAVSTASVGAGGGAVIAAGFELDVPAGALATDQQITVYRTTSATSLDRDRVSEVYGVGGLPGAFEESLTVTLELGNTPLEGETFIVLEEQGPGGGEVYVKATVSGNRATATLPPRQGSPFEAETQRADRRYLSASGDGSRPSRMGQAETALYAITGQHVLETEHFLITYPTRTVAENGHQSMADALEAAYAKLVAMSMSVRRFGKGKIEVHLASLQADDPLEPWGTVRHSFWTGEGLIKLNADWLESFEQIQLMKAKAAHTLLHLLQYGYDTRSRLQIALARIDFHHSWLWLDEATATWFERKMAGGGNYVPSQVPPEQHFLTLHELEYTFIWQLQASFRWVTGLMVRRHGYGASMFIEYLAKELGNPAWLAELYMMKAQGDLDGSNYLATEALKEIAPDIGDWWLEFCEHYVVSDVYSGVDLPEARSIPPLADENGIDYDGSVTKTVVWNSPGLIARFYRVVLKDPGLFSIVVSVEGDGAAIVRKISKTDVIGEKLGTVTPSNSPTFTTSGGDLLVMLVNTRDAKPYDRLTPVTLKLAPEEPLLDQLKQCPKIEAQLGVRLTCKYTPENGAPSLNECPRPSFTNMTWSKEVFAEILWTENWFTVVGSWVTETNKATIEQKIAGQIVDRKIENGVFEYNETSADGKSVREVKFKVSGAPYSPPINPMSRFTVHEFRLIGPAAEYSLSDIQYGEWAERDGKLVPIVTLDDTDFTKTKFWIAFTR